jgi:hypothetical protein
MVNRAVEYEKLIKQLGREEYLIEYRKDHYVRTITGPIGLQYAICVAPMKTEYFFTTKQQLSLLLSKVLANRNSSMRN